ncbi:hypothetical protein FZEAL_2009 [Fusarium zealandicum]|uniref:NACHT domain-containing protein n=1 Tax=Fusarium zealandicum TaxID=1053134 RepID=A0A8H4URN0_9HYPO|nr:hypothetical protein FZEAL_2009 [Fusarium zealandicum]
MSDPLSISASIAGLVALADLIFKHVYKYARAAKDAKEDIQALAEEVNDIARVLRVLGALAYDLERNGDRVDPALKVDHLGRCDKTLNKIKTKVEKADNSLNRSRLAGITRQLKWPFSASETKETLAELGRHKASINLALATDSMRDLQLCLSKTDEIGKQVTAIVQAVRKIEINTLIHVDGQKQRVLNYFMKTSPQRNLETSIKLRQPMTGLWLTQSQEFLEWLETPGSKLWLTGIPGAGKTVLAGSVVQDALTRSYDTPDTGAAFFFCDYKSEDTWDTVNILGAIVSQLARQKDEAFEMLRQYYDDLNPPAGLPKTPDAEGLRTKITEMSELFTQAIIVVDGLDECGDTKNVNEVVDSLLQVADYSENVTMALLSRDHYNIREFLAQEFEVIPIAAHTEDIQRYVSAELQKRIETQHLQLSDVSMRDEITETLVNRAEGMFRWVVCQIDYLCECAHDEERREALKKLPPDLPESYRRLLERINRCSPLVQSMVQMCLQFIAHAEPKLTILQLQQAVSTPAAPGAFLDKSNTVSEQEISRRCSSLIRKSQDGEYFEFAHFSVQEFLENEDALSQPVDLHKYFTTNSISYTQLAAQCLRFLQLENFSRQATITDDEIELQCFSNSMYPFYDYAATFTAESMTKYTDDSVVLGLAKALFHPSKTAQFVIWSIKVFNSFLQRLGTLEMRCLNEESEDNSDVGTVPEEAYLRACKTILDTDFTPLHMAAALKLPEICRFLIDQGVPVNARSDRIK